MSGRIGLYGGRFDPIHNAHLMMAQIILESLSLDKIVFIPSSVPPHKDVYSSAKQRLKMIDAAILANPVFESSDIEFRRQGVSYTIDTVNLFSEQAPGRSLYWLMGSDSFIEFDTWKSPDLICAKCRLAVFPRRQFSFENGAPRFKDFADYVNAPKVDISSTMIREYVRKGQSIAYMVPERVATIIGDTGLYRD